MDILLKRALVAANEIVSLLIISDREATNALTMIDCSVLAEKLEAIQKQIKLVTFYTQEYIHKKIA